MLALEVPVVVVEVVQGELMALLALPEPPILVVGVGVEATQALVLQVLRVVQASSSFLIQQELLPAPPPPPTTQ